MSATTPEGAIIALLAAAAAVGAIVTAETGQPRIHPMTDPQKVPRPKLTVARWGTDRSSETGGLSNDGSTGYGVAKMFVDAWADDQLTAKQLITAARKALHGYSGTIAGFTLLAVVVADEREQPGALAQGQEKPVQRVTLDVRVSFGD